MNLIKKYCNDCKADITADPLTHDCPQRRVRLADVTARDAEFIRRFRRVALLIALAGIAVWALMIYAAWRMQ